jgi:hypothetical protein
MQSPFPGMDPFIESQEWEDFHTTFNTVVRELLAARVEPRYVVRVECRVYVERGIGDAPHLRRADVAVLVGGRDPLAGQPAVSAASAVLTAECVLPMPEEHRETYLVIRERDTMEVVTVIETLSQANKRIGGDGRREYLEKRGNVLQSRSHLVELDLLRSGVRMPSLTALPPGDYYAIVCRANRRPKADVFAWSVRQPLPAIPVPLSSGDPDAVLELQSVFTAVYGRARYDLSLNYESALEPPLNAHDAAWARELLTKASVARADSPSIPG